MFKKILLGLALYNSILLGLEYHTDGIPIYEPIDVIQYPIDNVYDEIDVTVYPMTSSGDNTSDENSSSTNFNASIYLTKGWNLIGIKSKNDLSTIKKNIGEGNFVTIKNASSTNFDQLEVNKGYWIKVAQDVTLEYYKLSSYNRKIRLEAGWNLINPFGGLTLFEILSQLGDANVLVIQGLNKTYQKAYENQGKSILNDFERFEEDKGYWIKVNKAVTLDFTGW